MSRRRPQGVAVWQPIEDHPSILRQKLHMAERRLKQVEAERDAARSDANSVRLKVVRVEQECYSLGMIVEGLRADSIQERKDFVELRRAALTEAEQEIYQAMRSEGMSITEAATTARLV